jgi:integrase
MSGKRRRFGRVRRLPSGRFQVRYSLGDGSMRRAPSTFATQAEAEQFLAMVEVDLNRGTWFDPEAGDIRLDVYAPRWLVERPVELQPRTVEIYTRLLNLYLYPAFGATPLNRITSAAVRTWHASLRQRGVGQVSTAKAYRLLKAILNTAVEDELIPRNPCRLKAAGVERSPERRPPSLPEVELIADCVEPRYRLLVLLGAWSGLRWGELAALTRQRVDRMHGVVHVVEAMVQADGGHRHIGPPKSAAGRRTVAVPPHLWPEIDAHLAAYVGPEPTALLFTKASGASLDRANFHTWWRRATRAAGVPDYRFHDLRHLAATMAAVSGATTRELMRRMGHSSQRAALIYQHATEDRDLTIAEAMSKLVQPQPLPQLRQVADGEA